MSFVSETEHSEVKRCNGTYYIDCPYCEEKNIEAVDIGCMPWEEDELMITCPKCHNTFNIRPRYTFQGFFIYTDDEVKLKNE